MPGSFWGTPDQLVFLKNNLSDFQSCQRSKTSSTFWTDIYQAFFARWPNESTEIHPPPPIDKGKKKKRNLKPPPPKKKLTHDEWLAERKTQIYNWFYNRSTGNSQRKGSGPVIVIGDQKPKRLPSELQLYAHKYYKDRVQPTVITLFKSSQGVDVKDRLPMINDCIYKAWLSETDEVKQEITEELKKMKEQAKQRDLPSATHERTAEEYAAHNREILILQPTIKAFCTEIYNRTGYAVTVLAGGPDPDKRGSVRAMAIHNGADHLGQSFSMAYPNFHEHIVKPYQHFLSNVYSPETILERYVDPRATEKKQEPNGAQEQTHSDYSTAESEPMDPNAGEASSSALSHPTTASDNQIYQFNPFDRNDQLFVLIDKLNEDLRNGKLEDMQWTEEEWQTYNDVILPMKEMDLDWRMPDFPDLQMDDEQITAYTTTMDTMQAAPPLASILPTTPATTTSAPLAFPPMPNFNPIPPAAAAVNPMQAPPPPVSNLPTTPATMTSAPLAFPPMPNFNPIPPAAAAVNPMQAPPPPYSTATAPVNLAAGLDIRNGQVQLQHDTALPSESRQFGTNLPDIVNKEVNGQHVPEKTPSNLDTQVNENGETRTSRNRRKALSKDVSTTLSWLEVTKEYLGKEISHPKWLECIGLWYEFEKKEASEQNTTSIRIPHNHRPEALKKWLAARKYNSQPAFSDNGRAFSREWLKWWNTLQPEWRQSHTEHSLPLSHEVGTAKDDLGVIRKGGPSGIMAVLVGLKWWAALGSAGDVSWENAVEDVLLCFKKFNAPVTKRKCAYDANEQPQKKTQKGRGKGKASK
ncbi:hypothetical protein CPC08DRAFT_729374 [Agrocybe pediades]|nr:hypothetical protein CPC08DRAFT_729374 [Agrocybe pediades]